MEITQKVGLGLLFVNLAVIIAIIVMHPTLSMISIIATLYIGWASEKKSVKSQQTVIK